MPRLSAVSVLDEIIATKVDEVTLLHQPATRTAIHRVVMDAPPTRDFVAALAAGSGPSEDRDSGVAVIAEMKRRSPSAGDLAPDLDPAATALAYERGGAAALSVLTDNLFFGGRVSDLGEARRATSLAVLRKDFIIDETQVWESRAIGADAILLIVAALGDDALLADLHTLATELDLGVLIEAHDDAEIDRAVAVGARVIGVNSRDLSTFAEDLAVAERHRHRIPEGVIAVAESAIRTPADASRMARAGYDAVLVGEMLVRAEDPTTTLRSIIGGNP